MLVDAVDDTLIVQRGRQLGYTQSEEEYTFLVETTRHRADIESDAQWLAFLNREHMTVAGHRRKMERGMIIMRVRGQDLAGMNGLTEEEQRTYFSAHLDEFPLMSFEQAREVVMEEMHAVDKLEQYSWGNYVAMLRSTAVIEWKRADLKRAYADGLTQQAKALAKALN
jgi:hypothetical protein